VTLTLSELAEATGAEPMNFENSFSESLAKAAASQRRFDPLSYWVSSGAFDFGLDVRGCLNLLYTQGQDEAKVYEESFKRVTDFVIGLSGSTHLSNAMANHREFTDVIARTMSELWSSPIGSESYTATTVKRQVSYALALTELCSKLTPAHVKLQDSLNTILRVTEGIDSQPWRGYVLGNHSYLADRRDAAFYRPSEQTFAAYEQAVLMYRTSASVRDQMLELGFTMDDYRAYHERINQSLVPIQVELLLYPLTDSI